MLNKKDLRKKEIELDKNLIKHYKEEIERYNKMVKGLYEEISILEGELKNVE